MAIIDRIKFDGLKSRDWVIYKHPSESLVIGTQLIVGEGQAAIFVKRGRVFDTFGPGTYTLDGGNLPLLQGLINLPFGGQTPWTAEVYYVNTTTRLELHWGTSDPIQLIDPKYYIRLRVRAFGQMGLKISDYETFFKELVGAMNPSDLVLYDKIISFYKGLLVTEVKTIVADVIINQKISALEISTRLSDISDRTREELSAEFSKYGFTVANFFIQSINFPEEDFQQINKLLEDKAAFEIIGDNRYSVKRAFDVYETAAGNENGVAGVLAAGGIGLGAGVAVAGGFGAAAGNVMRGAQPATAQCPACGNANQPGAKFCCSCGAVILQTVRCPQCEAENPPGTKFCSNCGVPLQACKCACGQTLTGQDRFCPSCGKKAGEQ